MNILITMAGRGARFLEAGYSQPKYMIEVNGKTLFEWSLLSLSNLVTEKSKFIFVCLKENMAKEFVQAQCHKLFNLSAEILELDNITDGQATTAMQAILHCDPLQPLLIYNIDTHIKPEKLNAKDFDPSLAAGIIPCFKAPGEHWSFAAVTENNIVTKTAEKERISPFASIGLYWFSEPEHFLKAYENDHNFYNNERYIAPLYNDMIKKGLIVKMLEVPFEAVIPLGTPKEVEQFKDKKY